jgi:hypothetical protein
VRRAGAFVLPDAEQWAVCRTEGLRRRRRPEMSRDGRGYTHRRRIRSTRGEQRVSGDRIPQPPQSRHPPSHRRYRNAGPARVGSHSLRDQPSAETPDSPAGALRRCAAGTGISGVSIGALPLKAVHVAPTPRECASPDEASAPPRWAKGSAAVRQIAWLDQAAWFSCFSEAMSITKRYFTSLLSMRSYASLICCIVIISMSDTIPFSAQ